MSLVSLVPGPPATAADLRRNTAASLPRLWPRRAAAVNAERFSPFRASDVSRSRSARAAALGAAPRCAEAPGGGNGGGRLTTSVWRSGPDDRESLPCATPFGSAPAARASSERSFVLSPRPSISAQMMLRLTVFRSLFVLFFNAREAGKPRPESWTMRRARRESGVRQAPRSHPGKWAFHALDDEGVRHGRRVARVAHTPLRVQQNQAAVAMHAPIQQADGLDGGGLCGAARGDGVQRAAGQQQPDEVLAVAGARDAAKLVLGIEARADDRRIADAAG